MGGPVRERYGEGTLGQIHGQMVAHRPADHAARVQIEHDGEIGQTLVRFPAHTRFGTRS